MNFLALFVISKLDRMASAQKTNELLVFKALFLLLHTLGKSYVTQNYQPPWTSSIQAFTLTDLSLHVGMIPAMLDEQ